MTILPLTARFTRSFSLLSRTLKRRRVYQQLSKMDGHLLNDIGLTRSDVERMRTGW
jgi:uncharacterized protein YjiS (DUF1127 family)